MARGGLFLTVAASLGLAVIWGCGHGPSEPLAQTPDYWPTEGWRAASPESQGVSSQELARAIALIRQQRLSVHSLLLIRHGYVILDASFFPYQPKTAHDLASVTKSMTSTLAGIAVRRGLIESVDMPVLDFFPETAGYSGDLSDQPLTLRHLLTMTAGLDCGRQAGESEVTAMQRSPDWAAFVLGLPRVAKPGETFAYCSPGMHLLSAIISQAAGMSTLDFARTYLFNPLGISTAVWPADPRGNNHGWGGMQLRPHDLAKIGLLMLQGGRWDGRPILADDWVEQAVKVSARPIEGSPDLGYGFGWWLPGGPYAGVFEGRGRGGQYLTIWPQQDLVLVMTGAGYQRDDIVEILTRALAASALPASREGRELLDEELRLARLAPPRQPLPTLPQTAWQISGRWFELDPNELGLAAFSLDFDTSAQAQLTLVLSPVLAAGVRGSHTFAVGLNGVHRLTRGGPRGLTTAVRGEWDGDDAFLLDYMETSGANHYLIRFHFLSAEVEVEVEDLTGLYGRQKIQGMRSPLLL